MEQKTLYLLALSLVKGLGPVGARNLISYCGGNAEAVFTSSKGRLLKTPGIGPQTVNALKAADTLRLAEKELNYCQLQKIKVLSFLDQEYPHALKFVHDAPLVLFKKGNVNLNAQTGIAIVGTRKASSEGREISEEFARFFAQLGINVVSGLAYGIDIAAHKGALNTSGITTAVLGHGLDQIYPSSHSRKAFEMLERGGLVTEYLSYVKPDAPHFPARNRIIAGICKAIIVIEAAESGGALITARQAFDQNREVYAIPGRLNDPYSKGCNHLIRDQIAKLITSPEEVLDDLDIQWRHHKEPSEAESSQLLLEFAPPANPLSAEESRVLSYLIKGEALIDHITHHTGIPSSQLNALLLSMEFKGLVRQTPGKRFRKV